MKKKIDYIKRILGNDTVYVGMPEHQIVLHKNITNFLTINEALAKAKSGALIKVYSGLYREELVINKEITIQKATPKEEVILYSASTPVITIDIQNPKEKVRISKLKIASSVQSIDKSNYNNFDLQSTTLNDYTNRFTVDSQTKAAILLLRGSLYMEECYVSLSYVTAAIQQIIFNVAIKKDAFGYFSKCIFRGSQGSAKKKCIGIASRMGNLGIRQCKVINCSVAGLFFSGSEQNQVHITSTIVQGSRIGIVALGDFNPIIANNVVKQCSKLGIKVGICSRAKITDNEISQCGTGIFVISNNALISSNKIYENSGDGIESQTKDEKVCQAIIRSNALIAQNHQNGIKIIGKNNRTKVESNSFIGYNRMAGICVQKGAEPHIFKNRISKNMAQGILVKEQSFATIQYNSILDNIKANVAIGGQSSSFSSLVRNTIQGGRCQGVFLLQAEKTFLYDNQISDNYNGLICCTSMPIISQNRVMNNKNVGMLCVKGSAPTIFKNKFQNNRKAGVFISDLFTGEIFTNQFQGSQAQFIIQQKESESKQLLLNNSIKGEVRIPSNYNFCCCIF